MWIQKHKVLWLACTSIQSLQLKITSLTISKWKRNLQNFMALCAQIEVYELQIAPKQVHSPYQKIEHSQTSNAIYTKTKTKSNAYIDFHRDLTAGGYPNQNLGAHQATSYTCKCPLLTTHVSRVSIDLLKLNQFKSMIMHTRRTNNIETKYETHLAPPTCQSSRPTCALISKGKFLSQHAMTFGDVPCTSTQLWLC